MHLLRRHQGMTLLVLSAMLFWGAMPAGQTKEAHRLALLVAAPWKGETAMQNDLVAIRKALRLRGFSSEEIHELEGRVDRESLMSFLTDASRRVSGWRSGEILLYYSGHGGWTGTPPSNARAGLWLDSAKDPILWDELFAKLRPPAGVKLILLPDS